jgi:hypothetical protein
MCQATSHCTTESIGNILIAFLNSDIATDINKIETRPFNLWPVPITTNVSLSLTTKSPAGPKRAWLFPLQEILDCGLGDCDVDVTSSFSSHVKDFYDVKKIIKSCWSSKLSSPIAIFFIYFLFPFVFISVIDFR